MDSLEQLIETLPVADERSARPDSPAFDQASYLLRQALEAAEQPVLWLNQLAITLDAASQRSEHWQQALPAELRDHAQAITQDLPSWHAALERQLAQQAKEHADLLALGSQPASYPRQLSAQHQDAHVQRLLQRFGQGAPGVEALKAWRALLGKRLLAWKRVQTVLSDPSQRWEGSRVAIRESTLAAMRAEADLQVEEGQLSGTLRQRLLAPADEAQVVWLEVRMNDAVLPGAWVLAEAVGWSAGRRDIPLMLWVHGESGGMACLDDRQALSERLAFTLREGGLALSSLLPEDEHAVQLVPVERGLEALLETLLAHWQRRLGDDTDEPSEQERRLELARAALSIPLDTCRQAALARVERQWQVDALVEHIPQWVLSRSDAERQAYAGKLRQYHVSALALESWLNTAAPSFSTWAGNLLTARIKQDLGIEIDADDILLWRPDPSMDFKLPYLPSSAAQIASEGFDPDSDDEFTRLDRARWHVEGIEADYLARVLRELDPLKQYQALMLKTFDPQQADDPERLQQPYRLELELLATSERWRGTLSEEGARMLREASAAQSRKALQEAGLTLHWVVVVSREELGQPIEGVAALVNAAGRALLYLPGATANLRLIERDSLAQALEVLASAIASTSEMASYVANRCGRDPAGLLSYLRQAAMRDYQGYLQSKPSLEQTLVGLQLAERRNLLLAEAAEQGRSQASIRKDSVHAAHLRHVGYLRSALGVVPGLGTWYAVTDIHDGALEVADSWRTGSSIALIRGTLTIVVGLIELLETVLPVGSSIVALRRVVRQVARQGAARAPFRGYASGQSLDGAEPLLGADANTWQRDGKQYIWQDGLAYEVYRRSDEATLRLRATATRRYEAPVRQDGGRWVMHADVGLRGGGGKLTEAERLFADWGPSSRHRPMTGSSRAQAVARGRRELARYRFVNDNQQLEFAYSYLQDGTAPAWAHQYLRSAPTPGVEASLGDAWQGVRWNVQALDRVVDLQGGRVNISFGSVDAMQPGVRIQGHYYPILGGEIYGDSVYVRPVGRAPDTLVQLDALIEQGTGPVRISLGATPVDTPTVLGGIAETFRQRLARRFPSLSDSSRHALGETLYRNADRGNVGLTHGRLTRLSERIDDLSLEPLREMTPVTVQGLVRHMALEAQGGPLRQLVWELQPAAHTALRNALGNVAPGPFAEVLRDVAVAMGYQVVDATGNAQRHLMLLRRAGQPELYVLLQSRSLGPISLQGANGMQALSDPWMDALIAALRNPRLAATVRVARRHGFLRPVLGGVHLDGPNRSMLVWERVLPVAAGDVPLPHPRNWRHELRPLAATDHELIAGRGLYGVEGQLSVQGVNVEGRLLPVFPAEPRSQVLLSRSTSLSRALSFDDLERCVRERFSEQPWMIVNGAEGWSVRRPLFHAPLDRHVGRARTGLTRQSSLNAAQHVFERAQGSDYERLIELEHVTSSWSYGSRPVDELADPLLLLTQQRPTGLDSGSAWRLGLTAEVASASPATYYLRAVDDYTANLAAAVGGVRMRAHGLSLIDDMLVRYGLNQEHRVGAVAVYSQASSNRTYLVAMAVSEQPTVEFAFSEGRALMSDDWLQHWRPQLPEAAAQRVQQAYDDGRLVRMVAVLRRGEGPHAGQVALQRLDDF